MADPSTISGLVVRYRADSITGVNDGGNVTSWPDSGPNGYTAVNTSGSTTAPTYRASSLNGQPGVRFTATSKQFMTSIAPSSTNLQTIVAIIVNASPASPATQTIRSADGQGGLQFRLAGGKPNNVAQAVAELGTSPTSVSAGASVLISTYDSGVGSSWRVNGVAAGSVAVLRGLTTRTTRIGSNPDSANEEFNGDILELLTWNRVLTAAEQATVDTYAQDRYGVVVADYVGTAASSATYAGTGTLAAASSPAITTAVGYGGTGTLTSTGSPTVATAAAYSVAGALSTAGAPTTTAIASYSGTGTLTPAGAAVGTVTAAYTGAGALTVAATFLAAGSTAAYSGSGTLSSAGRPAGAATAAYTGAGTLAVSRRPALSSPASYAGGGRLSTTSTSTGSTIFMGATPIRAAYYGGIRLTALYLNGNRFAWA
jgi:hypothetical protein